MAILITWTIKPGMEDQFCEGWRRETKHIQSHGGGGSRLHRAGDNMFVAYARWPSRKAREETFEKAADRDPEARRMVEDATQERLPDMWLTIEEDMLVPEAELPALFHV